MLNPLARSISIEDKPEHLAQDTVHSLVIVYQLLLQTVISCALAKSMKRLVDQPDSKGKGQVYDYPDEEDVDDIFQDSDDADDDRSSSVVKKEPSEIRRP